MAQKFYSETYDEVMWGYNSVRHSFAVASSAQTAELAHAFADVVLTEQRSGGRPFRLFKLGLSSHRGMGKTHFTDAMLAKGGPLKKHVTMDEEQFEGTSHGFGKVVRADSRMTDKRHIPMTGHWREPWKLNMRRMFTWRGLDIIEHPFHINYHGYCHALVTLMSMDKPAPDGTDNRKITIFLSPVLDKRASVREFLSRTSRFHTGTVAALS